MEAVPALIAILRADSVLRKLCGKRMHQNQAPPAYCDPGQIEAKGRPAFLVVTRRAANVDEVLHPVDVPDDPDEELFDVDVAAGDPETVERICERIRRLLHAKTPTIGSRTAGYSEVRDQDEGWSPAEELIEQGFDVASIQLEILY